MARFIGMPYSRYALNYERDRNAPIGDYISQASDIIQQLQDAGQGISTPYDWAPDLARDTITRSQESPGMTAGEYAAAKGRVTGAFRAATGALAKGAGKGGFFDQASTAQAAGNAPSAALAAGLTELEAKKGELARREREGGLNALTQLTPTFLAEANEPRDALGALAGSYVANTPLFLSGTGRRREPSPYF